MSITRFPADVRTVTWLPRIVLPSAVSWFATVASAAFPAARLAANISADSSDYGLGGASL